MIEMKLWMEKKIITPFPCQVGGFTIIDLQLVFDQSMMKADMPKKYGLQIRIP